MSLDDFGLLETMLYRPNHGIEFFSEHLIRLRRSREYFYQKSNKSTFVDFPSDEIIKEKIDSQLLQTQAVCSSPLSSYRIRLVVDSSSNIQLNINPEVNTGQDISKRKVVLDFIPVDSKNDFLLHKTTNRKIYNEARARNGVDPSDPNSPFDVILFNEHGYVTETSIANIALQLSEAGKNIWVTPPIECGKKLLLVLTQPRTFTWH
ncbi:hypothetical protein DSO57_1012171 [Entomophthora muscae]|uniref:Uncharacterized protein n=1 Tax=Entomophthora muscae TaxID=34485 RepID=A0ACC2THG5_9FUNG|nr:hypothetical protein DSO57_1012171 [Entomophthora muscae]